MAIFASQFNPVSPYEPVGLDTGTPQIGIRLPRTPEDKNPPEENTPARLSPNNPAADSASANAAAGAAANQEASAGAQSAAQQAAQRAAQQTRVYDKLMHLEAADTAGGNPATIHAPAQAAHPGILGDITNVATSGLHVLNNVAGNPIVRDIMHFGDPFHTAGISGAVADQSQVNPTIKPTRVFNPQRSGANAIEQGGPKTIQGQVEGNPAVDVQAPQYSAMPRGWSANGEVGPGATRLAVEAGQYNPYQAMIDTPSYSAMPRGWSAADRGANFTDMTGSEPGGAGWSANVNPAQFNSAPSGYSGLPRGVAANGGWQDELGSVLGDIADAL